MYIPPAFRDDDITNIIATVKAARLASLVTATAEGLIATPLPMFLAEQEGEFGTLYAHVARANSQWKNPPVGEGMAIFMGPDAYITPSWYATKQETGKVVPTWNYIAIHAYGNVEFFDDDSRLLDVITRLTNVHERERANPWAVDDAPADFIKSQLKGIVGLRMPISRFDSKRKMSQNRSAADRAGVIEGLAASENANDRAAAKFVPEW
ncbi:FMN-binding negative transcriptional regulator [Hyphomicrobium sp.]|uniref:FMN-binding negative transcriptional regulator n=1 Tax=Hyphomicrobium sp. TaxID=82 RepID=UPI002E353EC0|nr:FMN-binding negative transcriptional regulator [Hyphomicrobium sp.]HEX2841271.1 FMN-binding negative transcriptional regulator [Hyphomicrobium sp.]